jgi:hypothetical protein
VRRLPARACLTTPDADRLRTMQPDQLNHWPTTRLNTDGLEIPTCSSPRSIATPNAGRPATHPFSLHSRQPDVREPSAVPTVIEGDEARSVRGPPPRNVVATCHTGAPRTDDAVAPSPPEHEPPDVAPYVMTV